MNKHFKRLAALFAAAAIAVSSQSVAYADACTQKKTSVVFAVASYSEKYTMSIGGDWDGTSNAVQFTDKNGNFCFACDGEKNVTVVRTNSKGAVLKKRITLEKKHPLFGTVACDSEGNYYLVTGEENTGDNTNVNTVFISKYNSKGKHIKTVGDNGMSSLATYYKNNSATKIPFSAGNCAAAVSGDILAVNYARSMYSGHQSNSVFAVNMKTMEKVTGIVDYNSHSFAQRLTAYGDGFLFASEGDCYPRAFNVTTYADGKLKENEVFHFWVRKGTLNDYNMFVLNNNFAHMGGIVAVGKNAALVGTSAKSLSSKAESENEQLFIQVFDPTKELDSAPGYITVGKRSGLGGPNGDESVTDYGVKWLTNYDSKTKILNPQVVALNENRIVVLFEKYVEGKNKGVYYMVLDGKGNVVQKTKRFSSDARLNHAVMPVVSHGKICWIGNSSSAKDNISIFSLTIDGD